MRLPIERPTNVATNVRGGETSDVAGGALDQARTGSYTREMLRSPRALPAFLAFAAGASILTWIQPTLRWIALSPSAGESGAGLSIAMLLLGTSLGRTSSLAFRPASPTLVRFGFAQMTVGLVCGATTVALPSAGLATTLFLVAAGLAFGAASQALREEPVAVLAGATTGSAIAGALVMGGVSIAASSLTSVAIMMATGCVALASARRQYPASGPPEDPQIPFRKAFVAFGGGALLAAFVMWADRALAPFTGSSIYAHAVLWTVTLAGCALGVAAAGRRSHGSISLGLLATAFAIATFLVYGHLEWIVPGVVRRLGGLASAPRALALTVGETSVLLLPVMVLSCAALGRDAFFRARELTMGAAIGTMFAAPLVAWVSASAIGYGPFDQRYGPLLYFRELGTGAILVTDDPEQGRILRLADGRSPGGVGTDSEDRVNALIPMLLHPSVKRVLQLGFGVGNGASSILAYPIDRLDIVDPTGSAAEISSFFDDSNLDVLSDERLVIHPSAPWRLLSQSTERWDLIALSAMTLESAAGDDMPTRERLRLAQSRLEPGGIVSLRLNVGRTSTEEIRTVLRTMATVFAHVTVWDGPLGYTWVINGSDRERNPDVSLIRDWQEDADVDAELGALGLDDVDTFLGHFVMGDDDVRTFTGPGPVVTTDRAIIDASGARSANTFFGLGSAAADTHLADLTAEDGQENIGLVRLFERLAGTRALKRAVAPHLRNKP